MLSHEDLQQLCARLPEVDERPSHGSRAFFAGSKGRMFASHVVGHHGDERDTVWLAAPEGAQEALIDAEPERFFRPPYVGHRGWLGVDLGSGVGADELGELLTDAYLTVAPARLARQLQGDGA